MELEELGEPDWLEHQNPDLPLTEADALWHDSPDWVDAYEF